MATEAKDDAQTRNLYNELRTGDLGVSFEALMREVYFLQHRSFTLFDAKDAFHSSTGEHIWWSKYTMSLTTLTSECFMCVRITVGGNERFLVYRDFQHAIVKLARARYETSTDPYRSSTKDNQQTASTLLQEIVTRHTGSLTETRMDALRRQLIKHSVLEVLELHLPKLIQSFQLYGKENAILAQTSRANAQDTSSTISLDGFLDFLNAYFEYEEFFSFQQIEQMVVEIKDAFACSLEPELEPHELYFGHFVELFCRVASEYHNQMLVREGAQLRRAIESCRLEFSIELLLQHMDIKLMQDDSSNSQQTLTKKPFSHQQQHQDSAIPVSAHEQDLFATFEPNLEGLTLEVDANEHQTFESLINDIRIHLEAFERANASTAKHAKRVQSVLFARLPPRKVAPDHANAILGGNCGVSDKIPLVTLIRELASPPQLPTNVLKKLENAITYQNMGQYHMALGALEVCKERYKGSRANFFILVRKSAALLLDTEDVEVRVVFHLTTASVLDSARKDFQALQHHFEALKLADLLSPSHHPGRALVKSSLGCMLYYAGEIGLAKKCHQQVLEARRLAPEIGDEHIDTATAMNNLACCLSQDPTGTAMEEAYLLLKSAKRIYNEVFDTSHPRVEVLLRNFERVRACQRVVVVDPQGALERGEYSHVIPGSRFQIRALVPIPKVPAKAGGGGKKGKKGGKKGSGGKKKK